MYLENKVSLYEILGLEVFVQWKYLEVTLWFSYWLGYFHNEYDTIILKLNQKCHFKTRVKYINKEPIVAYQL